MITHTHMTRFKKGVSGNPNGRPVGTYNKATQEIRQLVLDFLHKNIKNIDKEWQKLNTKEKLKFMIDLLPYVIDKNPNSFLLPDTQNKQESSIDLGKLTTETLERFVTESRLIEEGFDPSQMDKETLKIHGL